MRDLVAELVARQEPFHGTPEAAIAFAKTSEAAYRPANQAAFIGAAVDHVSFDDGVLEILTAKGGISIHIANGCVAYTLLDSDEPTPKPNREGAIQISLRDVRFVWDRSAIANTIIGAEFKMVAGSLDRIWLYFSKIGIVAVSVLVNKMSGEPFLYWDYSD